MKTNQLGSVNPLLILETKPDSPDGQGVPPKKETRFRATLGGV